MKNTIKFILSLVLLVSALQFSTACNSNTHQNPYDDSRNYNHLSADDGVILITQEVPADEYYNYDNQQQNENRYPISDYRYGYSYRATAEYQQSHEQNYYYSSDQHSQNYQYYNYNNYNDYNSRVVHFQDTPNYYYTYDDYMRTYSAHQCYVNPPSNQLIYVKCP